MRLVPQSAGVFALVARRRAAGGSSRASRVVAYAAHVAPVRLLAADRRSILAPLSRPSQRPRSSRGLRAFLRCRCFCFRAGRLETCCLLSVLLCLLARVSCFWLRGTVGQRRDPFPSASAASPFSPSRHRLSLRAFTPLQPPAARIARRREPVRRPGAGAALCAARDWSARSARAALRRARAGALFASKSTRAARLAHAAQQSSFRASTARGYLAVSVTSINSFS